MSLLRHIGLLFLFVGSAVSAQSHDGLILSASDQHIDMNSDLTSSGFVACGEGVDETAPLPLTRPNFNKHDQYCLRVVITNSSEQAAWMLHVNNFFYKEVKVTLSGAEKSIVLVSNADMRSKNLVNNVLGSGFPFLLEPGASYELLVKLTADRLGQPSYIGLMTQPAYERWSAEMQNTYMLGLGAIFGLILIAMVCGLVLRDMTFIWFAISSIAMSLLFFLTGHASIGLLHQPHVMPSWAWLLVAVADISLLFFARSFVSVDKNHPTLLKVFNVAIWICVGVLLLNFFVSDFFNSLMFLFSSAAAVGIIFYAAFVKVFERNPYYLLFMLGWVPILAIVLEHIYLTFAIPGQYENTLTYQKLHEPYFQIGHMVIHFIAMLIRILDLKKAKYQAQMENQAKSRFLASISHDLRQPLHSMGVYLGLLKDHITSDSGKSIFDRVRGLHISVDEAFRSLMDLGRLESGEAEVQPENIDLARFIEKLGAEHTQLAEQKGLSLRVRTLQGIIKSDPILLARMVRNLLSNAINYTENGGVLLALRRDEKHFYIEVWDTGCGIELVEQHVIFDMYKRTEASRSAGSGNGIGLATVKHIGDLMGYPVSVKSKRGSGSKFRIALPILQEWDSLRDDTAKETHAKVHVVIDIQNDTVDQVDRVREFVDDWGYPCSLWSKPELNENKQHREQTVDQVSLILIHSDTEMSYDQLVERVREYEQGFARVAVGVFNSKVDRALIDRLSVLNVHVLTLPFRPAQLRSLICFLEMGPS